MKGQNNYFGKALPVLLLWLLSLTASCKTQSWVSSTTERWLVSVHWLPDAAPVLIGLPYNIPESGNQVWVYQVPSRGEAERLRARLAGTGQAEQVKIERTDQR